MSTKEGGKPFDAPPRERPRSVGCARLYDRPGSVSELDQPADGLQRRAHYWRLCSKTSSSCASLIARCARSPCHLARSRWSPPRQADVCLMDHWSPEVALAFCSEGMSFFEKSTLLLLASGRCAYLSPGLVEGWLERLVARLWLPILVSQLDGLIVQSEYWRQFTRALRRRIRSKWVFVWHNCVDVSAWAPITVRNASGSATRTLSDCCSSAGLSQPRDYPSSSMRPGS